MYVYVLYMAYGYGENSSPIATFTHESDAWNYAIENNIQFAAVEKVRMDPCT